MSARQTILRWIREAGLMQWMDRFHFMYSQRSNRLDNDAFKKEHPSVKLPPEYMIYEAYKLNFREYYEDGQLTAREVGDAMRPFINLTGASVLEWGCGPARIVRHLPTLLPQSRIYGADYNRETIAWCQANIREVQFCVNELYPPLPFKNGSMDVVYAISVFTHLAAENHHSWMEEMHRIIKPGGIFLFTTQGNAFAEKLTSPELLIFRQDKIVVRGQVKEGHRSFSTFHPQAYVCSLLEKNFELLKLSPGQKQDWGPEQDMWIVKRR